MRDESEGRSHLGFLVRAIALHTTQFIIDKLRQFGLSDEQIAEALDIPLEQVKQVDLEE